MKYNEVEFKLLFLEEDYIKRERLRRKFKKKFKLSHIPTEFSVDTSYLEKDLASYRIDFLIDNIWSSETSSYKRREKFFEAELNLLNKKEIFIHNCAEEKKKELDVSDLLKSTKEFSRINKKIERLKKIPCLTIKEIRNLSRDIKRKKLKEKDSSEYIRTKLSTKLNKKFPANLIYSVNKSHNRPIKGLLIKNKENGIIFSYDPIIEEYQITGHSEKDLSNRISLNQLLESSTKASKDTNVIGSIKKVFGKNMSVELSDAYKEGSVHLEIRGSLSIDEIKSLSKKLNKLLE